MPLRDHFRPPLDSTRHWEALYAGWPVMIVAWLHEKLPGRYFAEPWVRWGKSEEIDVTTFRDEDSSGTSPRCATPRPTLAVETDSPAQDLYEVRVYDEKRHARLVAAVEIVSP